MIVTSTNVWFIVGRQQFIIAAIVLVLNFRKLTIIPLRNLARVLKSKAGFGKVMPIVTFNFRNMTKFLERITLRTSLYYWNNQMIPFPPWASCPARESAQVSALYSFKLGPMLVPVAITVELFHPIPCSVLLAASRVCVRGQFGGFCAVGVQVPRVEMPFVLAGEFRELRATE